MVDAALVAADLAFGLMLGCVLAVIAHGLNLIWGVARVVNVAHGEFIMLGAYGAYFLNLYLGLNPLASAPVDAALGLGAGLAVYFLFLHRELKGKESITLQSEMVTLVSTFGLSLLLQGVARGLFSPTPVGIPWSPGSVHLGLLQLPLAALYVAVVSISIIALTHVFLNRTYIGIAIRAYSQDIPATQLMGINPTSVAAIGTSIGFCVTMAGGALLTVWLPTGIFPYMGALWAPISFVIVVLGGPGKMWGSLVGGLIMGIVIDTLPAFLPPTIGTPIAYAAAFLILIPLLVFRPEGILR